MNPDKPAENYGTLSRAAVPALLVLLLVPYILMINPHFYLMEGGSAHYLVLARSISSGQGISEVFLPEPVPHTKTPFMFPLFLAAADMLFGYNMIAVKILLFAFMAGAGIFIYLALRKQAPLWMALVVTALTLSSPLILSLMRRVLTEIPYMAFSFAALYFAQKVLLKEADKKDWILLSALLFAAYFTRTIAFILILAFLVILLYRAIRSKESGKDLALAAGAVFPTIVAAVIWAVRGVSAKGTAGLDYMSELLVKNHPYSVLMGATDLEAPLRPQMERAGLIDLTRRLWEQADFFIRIISRTLDPWLPLEGPPGWHSIVIALVIILTAAGLIVSAKQKKALVTLYFVGFLFIICLWPYRDPRFVIPIIPLFLFFMILGGEKLIAAPLSKTGLRSKMVQSVKLASALILLAAVLIINLVENSRIITSSRDDFGLVMTYEISDNFKVLASTGARKKLLMSLQWVRESVPENAVIMFHSPRVVFLVTDRKCANVPITKDVEQFWEYIDQRGVDYIIVDELYREIGGGINLFTPEYLVPALNARKDRYQTRFRIPGSQSAVVKVIRPGRNQ